ncbi:MAG: glycyl-radical enzyme activating protein [Kiritimatiellae bacterium]|nr:glycyl-radical enzyme activating protein [Kiritimatiellia bacterium]
MNVLATGWSEGFDGPGRRWVVYLKGCDFRCRWCASPESVRPEPELLFYPARSAYVGRACPHGAVAAANGGSWTLDRAACARCPDRFCVSIWQHPAFEWCGHDVAPAEIADMAQGYRALFGPDGGVTFGGGEPTLQAEELLAALAALRRLGLRTAVETNAGTARFAEFVSGADLLICDLKCVSADLHREWTGASNARVLANLRLAARQARDLWIRIPLVPGFNDGAEETGNMIGFLREVRADRPGLRVDVLRMHHLGAPKYAALGMRYPMEGIEPPSRAAAAAFVERLKDAGLAAWTAG